MIDKIYFLEREADGACPAGFTISKHPELPSGDFSITEYTWPNGTVLWFIDDDKFTADGRDTAYKAFITGHGVTRLR